MHDVIRRRAKGEPITDESITAENPDLLPELADELRKLLLIERARQAAQHLPLIQSPAAPPRTIAHFEIVERLGTGGFGTVWIARDTRLNRMVALKTPREGQLDADHVDDFLHEARFAAHLKHPNIVGVYEIGRDGDVAYIVSDLVQGAPLSDWRRDLPLTFDETAELIATVASALHYAHEEGIVHRDLKPANILMDLKGQPHLSDFGLARWEADEIVTLDGRILGTPGYMSPEQASGDSQSCDRRTDIYSLGVVLFELLTGELPFRGQPAMQIQQTVTDEPPSPRKLNGSVPRDLDTICLKCLEKKPEQRYATAQDLAEELQRFLKGGPILARSLGRPERVWRWCRRHPIVPGSLVTLFAIVASIYGWGWYGFQQTYTPLDNQLTSGALASDAFAATLVAQAAGRDLERYYDTVEQSARDPLLVKRLIDLAADPQLSPSLEALNDPRQDPDEQDARRSILRNHPKLVDLQARLADQAQKSAEPVFAWFVLDAAGLQLARYPIEDSQTIGHDYAWRSYFHNLPTDQPENWRPEPEQRLTTTKLSQVFVSQFTNQWVVVVSTPIMDGDRFLGVFGVMIESGKFVKLPGNEIGRPDGSSDDRFAVLVDAREINRGRILQHPSFSNIPEPARRELLDRSQFPESAVELDGWTTHRNYRDPLAADHRKDTRWLAAQQTVEVRGQQSGLAVIVQENYDHLVGSPLKTAKWTLITFSLVPVVFIAGMALLLLSLVPRLLK
jgi:hypothetical protein